MSASSSHADILDEASFAPLKRYHACLQCRRRKVKCDGTKPTCAPCMRSHVHALRTAQRNKVSAPSVSCTWADFVGWPDLEAAEGEPTAPYSQLSSRQSGPATEGKKRGSELMKSKASLVGGGSYEREKEKRRDEEKETLLLRIAELEHRLAGLSSSDTSPDHRSSRQAASSNLLHTSSKQQDIVIGPALNSKGDGSGASAFQQDRAPNATFEPKLVDDYGEVPDTMHFSGLFVVPDNWPRGLPAPFLLEHLIDVFFTHAPQMSRMIHRPSFMTRLKLPPVHPGFPHSSLLHAMCAFASTFTAWVSNLPPNSLDRAIEKHKEMNGNLDDIADFGLAQATAAQKSISLATQSTMMQSGHILVEICQACIMLTDIYFAKSMPMQGLIVAGTPPRILKALEIMNKNQHVRYKDTLIGDPVDCVDRETRLATVWMTFIMDAVMTLNSYWNANIDLDEVLCPFPISYPAFQEEVFAAPQSQSAHSPNMLAHHPVTDSFVLLAKAATLVSRVGRWLRLWNQRDMLPGDEMLGMRQPSFISLVDDIYVFQVGVPSAMKNAFRTVEASSTSAFDATVLLVNILPSVALCVLYEPFVDWPGPNNMATEHLQRHCEAVIGVLGVIPSDLDVTLIMTTTLTFCLYTIGRLVTNFVHRNLTLQQYALAARQQADLQTIQAMLKRYGQKHPLGHWMSSFLDSYLARLQRDEETTGMSYTREGDVAERQRMSVEPQNSHESNYIAAPQVHIATSTTSRNMPLGATASLNFQAAIGMDQMTNPSGYSTGSGFALPSLSTLPTTAGINSHMGHAGWTSDMLDLSSYLDYSAANQGTFDKISEPAAPAMSMEGSGYVHNERIEPGPYETTLGSAQQNMWSTILPESQPTLEDSGQVTRGML